MNALSLIGRGFRGRLHDHGGHCDVLSGSREDGCLPLALLDLIIYTACLCLRALSIEVVRARASIAASFIGLTSFIRLGSF